jgi:hypothetical protein
MGQSARETKKPRKKTAAAPHPLCAEAQADGVPCYEVGRHCEECERARTAKPRRSAK